MQAGGAGANQRRGSRTKAVLPVRIKGKDATGQAFDEMAHTLDVTTTGVRLGSVRRELNPQDEVTIFYRQVGLQALTQEKEVWGLSLMQQSQPASQENFARASSIA